MIKQFPINTASNHSLIMPQKRQKAFYISPSQTEISWQTYTKDKIFQYGLNLALRVATFAQMPRLQHLAEVEVKTFAQMPRLKYLRSCRGWNTCADVAAETLAQMSRLKHLRRCRGWNICADAAVTFLAKNPRRNICADAAAETFAQMPRLKHLRRCRGTISSEKIRSWHICADAAVCCSKRGYICCVLLPL
jgi:hypothetical protein